jgi:hypothetical protein
VKTAQTGVSRFKRPGARDGHTGVIHEGMFFVFGGDRHHMPFNDFYAMDILSELGRI